MGSCAFPLSVRNTNPNSFKNIQYPER
uniref:Uncharacterized protein n=1 Tax=Nelumbo nucifera TaxID=4432 RepID=A0A822ZPD5_NELNU|nr:TPA_asm: hypothetical protein HUJ06_017049 [Nelumbo nucifera]